MSSPMKLTSSASFSPSIRISLRLRIHQAQAKNFCRVLDIRVQKMMETYPELQLVLDFEVIDENAENNAQRVRRKNFYLRNGFHETGNYTMLRDERFEVVCNGGELRKAALKDLLRVLHEHRPEFPDVLI